jgi:Nucleotidyltransferase of unknown function (DUF6036)
MPVQAKDLWSLALHRQQVDPVELAEAVANQADREPLDYRTRLLIRDSVEALEKYWGRDRLNDWLAKCSARGRIESIRQEQFERPGFPSLGRRVVETTKPETIRQFLRDLGLNVHRPLKVTVGGSAALILPGLLTCRTEDIDLVDEVPAEVRTQYQLLKRLHEHFNLQLTHFQSHYLPTGWEQRTHSLESFGQLQVLLVDAYDVFLSKLFSDREKDRDDLRIVAHQLDKETLIRRFRETTAPLRSDAKFRQNAQKNWYILFGESLPEGE